MPSGGPRKGAGRPKASSNAFTLQKQRALHRFNDKLDDVEKLRIEDVKPALKTFRPEEILFMVANGMPNPNTGRAFSAEQVQAASVLIPYSIAKPASVQIHQVQRLESRQYSDEELERIAFATGGSGGAFAAAESPLFPTRLLSGSAETDGDDPS